MHGVKGRNTRPIEDPRRGWRYRDASDRALWSKSGTACEGEYDDRESVDVVHPGFHISPSPARWITEASVDGCEVAFKYLAVFGGTEDPWHHQLV